RRYRGLRLGRRREKVSFVARSLEALSQELRKLLVVFNNKQSHRQSIPLRAFGHDKLYHVKEFDAWPCAAYGRMSNSCRLPRRLTDGNAEALPSRSNRHRCGNSRTTISSSSRTGNRSRNGPSSSKLRASHRSYSDCEIASARMPDLANRHARKDQADRLVRRRGCRMHQRDKSTGRAGESSHAFLHHAWRRHNIALCTRDRNDSAEGPRTTASAVCTVRKSLEPISKSPEEDNEASELYEAEEVEGVVFPTDEDAALPLNPSKEALHEPTSHIAA